jgi:hypothetical protein
MSDVVKTILAVLITSVLSSVTTTQVLSVEIVNVKNSVDKLDKNLNERVDKIDDRLLETQLKQAQYLAAN